MPVITPVSTPSVSQRDDARPLVGSRFALAAPSPRLCQKDLVAMPANRAVAETAQHLVQVVDGNAGNRRQSVLVRQFTAAGTVAQHGCKLLQPVGAQCQAADHPTTDGG